MTRTRKSLAALTASALLAGPAVLLTAGPASADVEKGREFRFAGAEIDWSVEKERNRFEVDVDIDDARPGDKWKLVLRRDGKVVHSKTYTVDREGEVEFTKRVKNSKGKDRFKLAIRKVDGPKRYSTIVMR